MKITIVGAGRMGFHLAEELDREGQDVVLLDPDPERVEAMRTRLDVMAVIGSGCSLQTLRDLNIGDTDLMIAVTNSDEVNFVACLLARHLGVGRRIARVQSATLASEVEGLAPDLLGVDEVISTVDITAQRLAEMVTTPGTTESAEFAGGRMVLRALTVPGGSPLARAPLREVHRQLSEPFLIAAVRRGSEVSIPTGDFQVAEGDRIYAVVRPEHLDELLEGFKLRRRSSRRVMIFGATPVGKLLCRHLEKRDRDVVLVDPDAEACEQAGKELRQTSVIRGSALEQDLMEDLKIRSVDYFLGLTEEDEANLSSALLANRFGVANAVMLASNPDYVDLFAGLPLAAVVSPILLSVGAVLALIRGSRVFSLFRLAGNRAEALEVEAAARAPAVGVALRDFRFPPGVVVMAVMSGDDVVIPGGDTVVRPGDRVVIMTMRDREREGVRLFTRK